MHTARSVKCPAVSFIHKKLVHVLPAKFSIMRAALNESLNKQMLMWKTEYINQNVFSEQMLLKPRMVENTGQYFMKNTCFKFYLEVGYVA